MLGVGVLKINVGILCICGWELSIDWCYYFNEVNVYVNVSIGDFKIVIIKWDNDS